MLKSLQIVINLITLKICIIFKYSYQLLKRSNLILWYNNNWLFSYGNKLRYISIKALSLIKLC